MKFISLEDSKVFHLLIRGGFTRCSLPVGESFGDTKHKTTPDKRLCKICKKSYISEHSEEELFIGLI